MELINTLINWVTTNVNLLIEYLNSLDGTGRFLVYLGCGIVGAIIVYLVNRGKVDFDSLVTAMIMALLTGGIFIIVMAAVISVEYLTLLFEKIGDAYNKKYPGTKCYHGIEDEFD